MYEIVASTLTIPCPWCISDDTPPKITCPQSYVVELVEEQEVYEINFNRSRNQVAVSDDTDEVSTAEMTSPWHLGLVSADRFRIYLSSTSSTNAIIASSYHALCIQGVNFQLTSALCSLTPPCAVRQTRCG